MRVHSRVRTLVFMFWENSRMVSTLVQASGWSFRLVRTSWATRCYNTEPPLYICSDDKYNLVKWRYLRSILKRNLTWVHILLLLIKCNILHLMNNCGYLLVCRFRLLSVDCLLQVDYWSIATEHQLKLHSFYSWRKYIQPVGGTETSPGIQCRGTWSWQHCPTGWCPISDWSPAAVWLGDPPTSSFLLA